MSSEQHDAVTYQKSFDCQICLVIPGFLADAPLEGATFAPPAMMPDPAAFEAGSPTLILP
jgi:hypothetical protein